MSDYRDGVNTGINEAWWTVFRLAGCFVSLFLFLFVLGLGCWGWKTTFGVVERVVNPDAIVQNYEWYEQQMRDIKAIEGQIKDAEAATKRFKDDNGPSKNWAFDQREEYARLNSHITGLSQARRSMIQTYNARASMITRNLWKSKTLPHQIEE